MTDATVLINNANATGTDAMPWAQDVLDNSDSSLAGFWLFGDDWNRTIVSGVTTKDYSGDRHLTAVGTPTVGDTHAAVSPTNYYTRAETVADFASGGAGGTVLNKAIGNLNYSTNPTNIANNDTLTINGEIITFKSSGASGTHQVNIGASGTITFTAVAALINANPDIYGITAFVIGTNHLGSIFFFAEELGVDGNAITLARSLSCTTKTLSGATLDNGDEPGITILAVAKTGASGKAMPAGFWDSGDLMQVSLGFWATGSGNYGEGVSANHYNGLSDRFLAKAAAQSGVEGVDYVFGAGAFMSGEAWAYRRHAALGAGSVARNTTGTPGRLPTATGQLRLGKAGGTNGEAAYPNGCDLAAVWIRNRFMTPMEIDADYAAMKALLAANGVTV